MSRHPVAVVAWCSVKREWVDARRADYGCMPTHHEWVYECPYCGNTTCLRDEEDAMECRRCGEVEVLTEPGVCESCHAHLRRIPGARL